MPKNAIVGSSADGPDWPPGEVMLMGIPGPGCAFWLNWLKAKGFTPEVEAASVGVRNELSLRGRNEISSADPSDITTERKRAHKSEKLVGPLLDPGRDLNWLKSICGLRISIVCAIPSAPIDIGGACCAKGGSCECCCCMFGNVEALPPSEGGIGTGKLPSGGDWRAAGAGKSGWFSGIEGEVTPTRGPPAPDDGAGGLAREPDEL
jgi:hypothetical protein